MSVLQAETPASTLPAELVGLSRGARTDRLLEAASIASPHDRQVLLERVIESNMPVAAQVAARYAGRGVPIEDLEQVAYLALVKAVGRYHHGPNRPFLAYAVPTIRGEIRRYFRDLGWTVRPGRRIQETQGRIRASEDDLCQNLGRAPRPSEIATHLGLDLDTVIEALAANGLFQPSSTDASPTGDESLGSRIGAEEPGSAASRRASL